MNYKTYEITTECSDNACDSQSLGYFIGSPKQAIAQLIARGVVATRHFWVAEIEVEDVSNVGTGGLDVHVNAEGQVTSIKGDVPESLKAAARVMHILDSLSDDDTARLEQHYSNKYREY